MTSIAPLNRCTMVNGQWSMVSGQWSSAAVVKNSSQLENSGRNPKGQINPKSGKEYRVGYNFGSN